ncbi:MAG: hypothetical protein ABGZ17_11220 [Planctomycetaceae bacterium]
MTKLTIIQNVMSQALCLFRTIARRLGRSVVVSLICGQLCAALCIAVIPGLLCLGLLGHLPGPLLVLGLTLSVTFAAILGRFSLENPVEDGRAQSLLAGTVWVLNLLAFLWLSLRGAYVYGCMTLVLLLLSPKLLSGGTASDGESIDIHPVQTRLSRRLPDVIDSDFSTFDF